MDVDLITFVAIGFLAQLIDGALGMAFGVISSTVLLTLGVSPAPRRHRPPCSATSTGA